VLDYLLRYGEVAGKVSRVAKSRGVARKSILPPEPELAPGLDFYLAAWISLDSCRPVGFGSVGRIPWTALAQFAEHYDLEEDDLEDLEVYIGAMDQVYFKYLKDTSPKGQN